MLNSDQYEHTYCYRITVGYITHFDYTVLRNDKVDFYSSEISITLAQ